MTSLQTSLKQIPHNNGYYRVVPQLCFGQAPGVTDIGVVTTAVSSYMYTLTAGVLGAYTPQSPLVQTQLSTGQALLKDMGVNFISSSSVGTSQPQIFRRVQVVNTAAGATTDGVSGTVAGVDADYDCAYIAMGYNGALPSQGLGPFIRTG